MLDTAYRLSYIQNFYDKSEARVNYGNSVSSTLGECFRGVDMWHGCVTQHQFLPDRQICALKILLCLTRFKRVVDADGSHYIVYLREHHQERSRLLR